MALEPERIVIPDFTKEDYLEGTKPYEWLYQYKNNPFRFNQLSVLMADKAKEAKVPNFSTLLKGYEKTLKMKNGILDDNTTNFTGQEFELKCGKWTADDYGIEAISEKGLPVVACTHPIMPIKVIRNIDTDKFKVQLAYNLGKYWETKIFDKETISSRNSIVSLSGSGISVTSENAKYLVEYFAEIERLNRDEIETVNAVSRLGWIGNQGFSPYVDDLEFDGEDKFGGIFESVKEKGSYEKWLKLATEARKNSIYVRICLAAAFASVLIEKCDALNFILHFWGGSDTGKSVALMLAASVWAEPTIGSYIQRCDSTDSSQEFLATFLNSMPLMFDELQIRKSQKDFDEMIYMLCEGVSKGRGTVTGGLRKTGRWSNCSMFTGEMPLIHAKSNAGAMNRVIEIDCKGVKMFKDPKAVVEKVKQNYGFAGKMFVENLMEDDNIQKVKEIQKAFFKMICEKDTTDKQAQAASMLLTADAFANEWIFKDGTTLQIEDILPFLSTKKDVSSNERALTFLHDFVTINSNKFISHYERNLTGEVWGEHDENYIYIIKSQFDKIMTDEGFNSIAFLSWAKENNIIETANGKNTKLKRIKGVTTRCVWIKKVKEEQMPENVDIEDIPY